MINTSIIKKNLDSEDTTLSPGYLTVYRALHHIGFWVGGSVFLLIVLLAIFAPLLTPYNPGTQHLGARLIPPFWAMQGSWAHPLGTDQMGRDYWSELVFGARVSLFIGFTTILISGVIGTCLGVAAGYWKGRVDLVVNFILTVRLSLPVVLVALVIVAVIGNSLLLLIATISGLLWDRFCIVSRTCTQQLCQSEFIVAARCIGSSRRRMFIVEILPNLIGPLTVVASIQFAHAIILAASLSFLGLGVQPPLTAWGLLVAQAKDQIFFRPWMIAVPGVALVLLILSVNLLGDAIRDISSPEGKN